MTSRIESVVRTKDVWICFLVDEKSVAGELVLVPMSLKDSKLESLFSNYKSKVMLVLRSFLNFRTRILLLESVCYYKWVTANFSKLLILFLFCILILLPCCQLKVRLQWFQLVKQQPDTTSKFYFILTDKVGTLISY